VRGEYTYVTYQPLGTGVATIKTTDNAAVTMRVAPSAGAAMRRQFAGDRYVSVLCQGADWWYVCIDGFTGFISADSLAEGLHAERDEQASDTGSAAVSAGTDAYALVDNPVSSHKLNLRRLPSTSADIVARLGNDTKLTMLEQGTQWSRVYVPSLGVAGYVMSRYLKLFNLPAVPTLTIGHPLGSYVNLRVAAGMTAPVIIHIPDGSTVVRVAPGQSWTRVEYNGHTGYVVNDFLYP